VNGKLSWSIFWTLLAVFIILVCLLFLEAFRDLLSDSILYLSPFAVFSLLGGALIVLTLRQRVGGALKKFFLLTGASAAGVLVSILLHAAIYALFRHFFGSDFWNGGDELFFFTMAVVVCPLGFLVGVVGSIALRIKGAVSP
jgi:hypothetical protein